MKKLLVLAAALLLAAAPAAAQQTAEAPAGDEAVVEQLSQTPSAASQTLAPSLVVSREEIQARVLAAEEERNSAQIGGQSFWYLVAAIALGVLVALLLVD